MKAPSFFFFFVCFLLSFFFFFHNKHMNQKEKKKQTGIVGSPQNVCHLMVGKGGEGGGREGGTEEKRMWFRKYKSKGRVTEFGMKKEEVLCDKKSAQMQMALSCISHEDEGAKEHGLKVLINLSLEPSSQRLMIDTIPSLISLMQSPSPMIQIFSTYVLSNIAQEPTNQPKIRENGGVNLALGFLKGGLGEYNLEILEKSLWLLANVTTECGSRRVVVEEGGVEVLAGLLGSPQMSVVVYTTQVLRNLFFDVETQLLFANLGGIQTLIHMHAKQKLSGIVRDLRKEWTRLVCVLAYYSSDIRAQLVKAGAVDFLCMLLSCADQEVVAHATQALTNLSADREFVEVIEETAGATSLIQQLISSKESVQEQTALLLTNLGLVSDKILESFPKYGGIQTIVHIIKEVKYDNPLMWKIIYLVATVSRDELCRRELLEMGVMPLVERVAQSKNENLKLACIMALYNLRLSFIHLKAHKEKVKEEGEEEVKLVEGDDKKGVMHRARVVNEIVNTEKQYVENLLVIVKVYQEPLASNPKLLSIDDRKKIFSIVDTLYAVHSNFLQKLQKVVLEKNPCGQIALGDVFIAELVQELKVYRLYINNYDESCDTLVEAMNRESFAKWLEEQTLTFKSKTLSSLLITPIQRIPRYCLLLTELLKYMPPTHPDHSSLTTTLQTIQDIANYLEEEKQKAYSKTEMHQMMAEIVDLNYDFTEVSWRRFIRQGTLLLDPTTDQDFMTKSNISTKVSYINLWLMTDLLVLSRPDKKSHGEKVVGMFELGKVKFSKVPMEADGIQRMVLKISTERGTLVVYSVEEEMIEDWHEDIAEVVKKWEEKNTKN